MPLDSNARVRGLGARSEPETRNPAWARSSASPHMLTPPMPTKYIVEMFMDRTAACKIYQKDEYTCKSPLIYYQSGKDPAPLHDKTRAMLEVLLTMLYEKDQTITYRFIKQEILPRKDEFDDINNLDFVIEFCKNKMQEMKAEV